MTRTRRHRSRVGTAAAAIGAIVAAASTATSIPQTEAQWSDSATFAATASTGTWSAPSTLGTCVIIDGTGAPVAGESCTVSSVDLVENGGSAPGSLFREYRLTVARSSADAAFDMEFRIDLASPDVGSAGPAPNPAWTWENASTTATAEYTITPGYPCSSLPVLEGTVPGTVTGPAFIDVHDSLVAGRTCSG